MVDEASYVAKIMAAEKAVKRALESLSRDSRFYDDIESYFSRLNHALPRELSEEKYEIVRDSISELWLDARKTADFLKFTEDFEPLLQDLGLRDHFVHSFNCFLLGYYIINQVDKSFPDKKYFIFPERHFNLVWMLTSTFHDVGYAVEKTEAVMGSFFKKFLGIDPDFSFRISNLLTPIYVDFMHILSQYHKRGIHANLGANSLTSMDWFFYNELCEKLVKKNHGVLGALMLCHRMAIKEGFLGNPANPPAGDEWDFYFYHVPASHAISLHHMDSMKVKFKNHPFAFMLILCDELQDWGRGGNKNLDLVFLKSVAVEGSTVPKICFEIDCSTIRRNLLIETLRKRLDPTDSLLIIVNDSDIFSA